MKTRAAAFAACLGLVLQPLAQPLAAQDNAAGPSLEDLIPDAAVADPEAWAQQSDQPEVTASNDEAEPIDAASEMEPMPQVTLEAPQNLTLPEFEPVEPAEQVDFVTFADVITPLPEGSEEQVSDELVLVFPVARDLFQERDEFLSRFRSLSTVRDLDDDGSQARLAAQARADEELLQRMLRTYGYFDGQVIRSVISPQDRDGADFEHSIARFDIIPGRQFTIGTVDLGDLAATGADYDGLRAAYQIFPGDPLLLDAITSERLDLDVQLGESGYPFAAIEEPSLLVDHQRQEGDVTMLTAPGGKYVFGQVFSNLEDFLSGEHLAQIARFETGDLYRRSEQQDLRRAILATGLVGSVTLMPVEAEAPTATAPGIVDMAVEMTQAPLRTITGSLGYGTEEGVRLAASWEHRNLFPSEGMLRVRGIAGTQEQLLGATFRKNNFHGRDRILTVDAFASTLDYDAYDARTASLVGSYERVSTLLFQKPFSWSVGLELVATGEREADATGSLGDRETYLVAALPLFAQVDTSDDLLDPTRGFRLSGRVSPEISDRDGAQNYYLRSQADVAFYQQVSENIVLAGRARAATIAGVSVADIAPSRRVYAGGGGSVRGYGYREIGPRNDLGDPTGGRSSVEFAIEARVRTGFLDGALGIVPFVDAGSVDEDSMPGFDNFKIGAGIGLRYHSSFGPIRLDVAAPINPGPNDAPVAVYIALGQAF